LHQLFRFGPYCLDPAGAQLLKNAEAVPLTPKALAVLIYLVERRGRLVSKEELLDAVWGRRFVSEGVLKNTVRALRYALDDDPKTPGYIETAHRLGYRFIAEVAEASAPAAATPAPLDRSPEMPRAGTRLVGRDSVLAQLGSDLGKALGGQPRIVFITGEPGIGKTALIDAFLHQVGPETAVARGQCVEQYGQSEAYLPVLEALNALGRQHETRLAGLLRQVAPTWLAQFPWYLSETDGALLQQEALGATQARMLRELGEFLERWTHEQPLILVLEDLHWSDHATLNLLAYLARRKRPARWLILGSYRPVEVILNEHPLKTVKRELQIQGLCRELPLELLSEAAVADYLAQRQPDWTIPEAWVRALHARTEGLPFFLVQLVENLLDNRTAQEGAAANMLPSSLPEGLQHLIEQQFERLPPAEQRLLETASVVGINFTAGAVAAALDGVLSAVEEVCERLARLRHFLRAMESDAEGRYGFLHAFYREFAYSRLAPVRRAELHRRVGAWLETAEDGRGESLAAELALHFERGRNHERAVHYLHQAAEQAVRRHALHEAADLLRQGLALLEEWLPDTPARTQRAADMYTALAIALRATKGYAAPELPHIYRRALDLSEDSPETPRRFSLLTGLWVFHCMRAELDTALDHAQQIRAIAERDESTIGRVGGHMALGVTYLYRGEPKPAYGHLQQALALYEPDAHRPLFLRVYTQDPAVFCRSCGGLALWLQGFPARALQAIDEGLMQAEAIAHPFNRGVALLEAAILHLDRREPRRTAKYCEALEQLCAEHGFALWQAMAIAMHGWTVAALGQPEAGIARIREGIAALLATGARMSLPYYRGLLAEACAKAGRVQDGLAALDEALAETERSGERRYEAETRRLLGELLLQADRGAPDEPETCFHQALATAHRQGAKSLELRAATSLARLWQSQGRQDEAGEMLSEIYGRFTEGFDTPDLREAKALLDGLNRGGEACLRRHALPSAGTE
jgi:DNA-binding winged helix-turn-helix (wHTH) protein/predicted ATPase